MQRTFTALLVLLAAFLAQGAARAAEVPDSEASGVVPASRCPVGDGWFQRDEAAPRVSVRPVAPNLRVEGGRTHHNVPRACVTGAEPGCHVDAPVNPGHPEAQGLGAVLVFTLPPEIPLAAPPVVLRLAVTPADVRRGPAGFPRAPFHPPRA